MLIVQMTNYTGLVFLNYFELFTQMNNFKPSSFLWAICFLTGLHFGNVNFEFFFRTCGLFSWEWWISLLIAKQNFQCQSDVLLFFANQQSQSQKKKYIAESSVYFLDNSIKQFIYCIEKKKNSCQIIFFPNQPKIAAQILWLETTARSRNRFKFMIRSKQPSTLDSDHCCPQSPTRTLIWAKQQMP